MSQTSHTSDQNNSRKRATVGNIYASTPINILPKKSSISLSAIDTASSSSDGRGARILQSALQDLAKEHKRNTKQKRRSDNRSQNRDTDSEWETKQKQLINQSLNKKRKKTLQSKKRAVKRKEIVTEIKDTDSEWETESEKSINELSIDSQGLSTLKDDERIKLFEDPPEKIRDVPSAYQEILLESPIIGSSKRQRLISKKNDMLQHELLPVNLLSSEMQSLEKTDEDEMISHYKSNAKTYLPSRKHITEKSPTRRSENYNSPIQSPTITKDFRRNQFVKTYFGKTSQHLVSSSARMPIKIMDSPRRSSDISWKIESTPIPSGMTCVAKHWDKTLQKWITDIENSEQEDHENSKRKRSMRKRKGKIIASQSKQKRRHDVYDPVDKIDNDFKTDGTRISFREFCRKQEVNKVITISSTSSSDT